jgi:hypothetical protein
MRPATLVLSTFTALALAAVPPAPAAEADEAQTAATLAAELMAGNYEKAATDAKAFLMRAKDKEAITEARRVLAESLRKQGQWMSASGAYAALSKQFEAGSEDALRYEAIGDVLKTTVNGVYKPMLTSGEKRQLSDDEALKAALAKWAEYRCERFKHFCTQLIRARSPQLVAEVVRPAAEEARAIYQVVPGTPAEESQKLAKMAGEKLGQIHVQVTGVLRAKMEKYKKKMDTPWSFTNVEKRDIAQTNEMCKQMAEAEVTYQGTLSDLGGGEGWAEATALRSESADRQAGYQQMAEEYKVPEYSVKYFYY